MPVEPPSSNPVRDAFAFAQQRLEDFTNAASRTEVEAQQAVQAFIEAATQTLGESVEPIANSRLLDLAARVPGLGWILAAVGRANTTKINAEVARLRAEHPTETEAQLCDRLISSAAITAGGVGLITNLLPPIALMLFAVDIAAVATLQTEMVYRIAKVYGFELEEPARRGEVMAIFGLSLISSGAVKTSLGLVEALPLIGIAVGVTSNAGLLYALGNGAQQYYALKRSRQS